MQSTERCPKQEELTDFLVGNMNQSQIETLELHLSDCQPCNETLRDLSSLDTFDFLAADAFSFELESIGVEDSNELASQIDDAAIELVRDKCKRWSSTNPPEGDFAGANPSLLAARASEVCAAFRNEEGQDSLGTFGPFRIEELLGAGSSGVVYLATDTNLDRQVALKVLRPSLGDSAKARFLAEAKATAAMDHPNVVSIYQIGVESGMAFIAMKWAPGETLASRMASGEKLSVGKVRQIGSQIAAGLAAAHGEGLIHRDIKPANIWLEEGSDEVKILDFGLVRATNEEISLTLTGMLAGTPCYMSPEQARGADLDARSDLFSLGCLLYQMLVGVLPFQGNNILAMLQAVQRDSPQHPHEIDGEVPRDLSALVMNLLQKRPADRPPKASVVSEAIVSLPSQWQFTPTIKPKKPVVANSNAKRIAWGIVALLAACVAGVAAFFSPQIIRIATDQGHLVIETSDPDIKIEVVDSGGGVRVIDLKTEQSIDIKSGAYDLRPISDENSVEIDRETIVMKRGGKEIVRVVRNESAEDESFNIAGVEYSFLDIDADESAVESVPSVDDDDHLLQPGDIVGVYVEGLIEPNASSGRRLYPLIINGGSELTHSELNPIDVRGRKLGDLYSLLRKSTLSGGKDDVPLSARIEVQLLRKCPAVGELPSKDTDVIPFSPSHSWQVMEALRSKELFRSSLLKEFGPRHPSVKVTEKSILETKEFLQEVKFAEKRVLNEKYEQASQLEKEVGQATLRSIETGGPSVFPEKNREINLLHKELVELEKAQLVNDLNWILLQDQIPYGLNRDERHLFMQDRIDAIRKRAKKKISQYSVEMKAGKEKGWSEEVHPRAVLLKSYSKLIPNIVKNLESGEVVDFNHQSANQSSVQRSGDLNESNSVSVQVTFLADRTKRPISGVVFRLYRTSTEAPRNELVTESVSDENGKVMLHNLPFRHSNYRYFLLARAEGYATQRVPLQRDQLEKMSLSPAGGVYRVSFVPAATLTGTVLDSEGNPVEGATVFSMFLNGDPIEGFTDAKSDSEGKFEIRDLGPYTARPGQQKWFRIRHPDFGPQYANVTRIPSDVKMKLDTQTLVKFRVVDDESKEPVPGYKVAAQIHDSGLNSTLRVVRPGGWIPAVSDKDGWVKFMAPSTVSYNISHFGNGEQEKYPRSIELRSGRVGSVTLESMKLVKATKVTGIVVDDETGKPVPNVRVGWYGPDRPDSSAAIRIAKAGVDGQFKANVVPGENRFYVYVSGWRTKGMLIRDGDSWMTSDELGKDSKPGFIPVGKSPLHLKIRVEKESAVSRNSPHESNLRDVGDRLKP